MVWGIEGITMHAVLVALASLLIGGNAVAQTAIVLQPMRGDHAVDVVKTINVTGSCGGAIVRVMGVTNTVGNFYTLDLDAGKVIVRSSGQDLVLDADHGLSDHDGVACITNKTGNHVLVWSQCGGSACPDAWDYIVIDADKLAIVSPLGPNKGGDCDAACASRLTGSRMPFDLNR
jgi:hypothetical protein